MVNLISYGKSEFEGTIKSVKQMPLAQHFEDRYGDEAGDILEKFMANAKKATGEEYDVDRDHLVLEISAGDDQTVYWFTLVPKRRGYNRSDLKKFVDVNGLPF